MVRENADTQSDILAMSGTTSSTFYLFYSLNARDDCGFCWCLLSACALRYASVWRGGDKNLSQRVLLNKKKEASWLCWGICLFLVSIDVPVKLRGLTWGLELWLIRSSGELLEHSLLFQSRVFITWERGETNDVQDGTHLELESKLSACLFWVALLGWSGFLGDGIRFFFWLCGATEVSGDVLAYRSFWGCLK